MPYQSEIKDDMKYSTKDFNNMSWHDCPVYSFKFDDNFELDLDYILNWKKIEENKYEYLISPAILSFKEVSELKIDVKCEFLNGFEIIEIEKLNDNNWRIELHQGEISFISSGFEQLLKKEPIIKREMYLSEKERT